MYFPFCFSIFFLLLGSEVVSLRYKEPCSGLEETKAAAPSLLAICKTNKGTQMGTSCGIVEAVRSVDIMSVFDEKLEASMDQANRYLAYIHESSLLPPFPILAHKWASKARVEGTVSKLCKTNNTGFITLISSRPHTLLSHAV